ncbi:protein-disulfide reductase DsbD family protein [Altererythrobacter sp. C41]|uniref:protein-disulfide reductase DsbD family protein n=1 Tax=Altererythrobacter sp. C41 TaxID=2806021 RepID=UPI0019327F24|nr:protein-disulfide reductase DsbD [Altererythrobacter sp. C41]MBM0170209.1 thioredoxin family protein [Altererythrobacter sp. C41]
MGGARTWLASIALALLAAFALLASSGADAQPQVTDDNIAAEIFADGPPEAGGEWLVALRFTPRSDEWHGYWSNPGDAGLGMELAWELPRGWSAGEPLYPVPHRLVLGGLMNHVYEGRYTVLVPIRVPRGANLEDLEPISLTADYLACTDKICVPQRAVLELDPAAAEEDPRFVRWRAQIAPMLDSRANFAVEDERLRIGIPLPADMELSDPHLFLEERELGKGRRPAYADEQTFFRDGDLLVAEVPLDQLNLPSEIVREPTPQRIEGILAFSRDVGVRFTAVPGAVPSAGKPVAAADTPALWLLVLGALAGGLFLNVMPCVFPILSLKALSLARAGESQADARREGFAYTAGVLVACIGLGALLLALRSAGEAVGWAFQLQEPAVVIGLLVLATAITANLAGLFELPSIALTRGGEPAGAFATGLLAAFVATPCTGPFMAAALGAALILPPLEALLLFAALGLGLALPFLAIGLIPALRRMLPRPGAWMATFRKVMAVPMALTALALLWLCFRLGGDELGWGAAGLVAIILCILLVAGRWTGAIRQAAFVAVLFVATLGIGFLPNLASEEVEVAESLLDPVEFSEGALAEARASGRPVFVWFTADWCVSCKVNESVAIEREATREAFAKARVVTLRGDWTRRDPAITEFLADHGAAGVPLYLWYAPGEDGRQLPQVLGPDALVTLAQAVPVRPANVLHDTSQSGAAGVRSD